MFLTFFLMLSAAVFAQGEAQRIYETERNGKWQIVTDVFVPMPAK